MTYEIVTEVVVARPIAAVRRRIRADEVGASWRPALDLVWAYLRSHPGVRTDGDNIFVYHHASRPGEPMDVDFGVEVVAAFEADGEVSYRHTPSGTVAWTRHVGSYDGLDGAYAALDAWCAAEGRTSGGASWEIYGDWDDDPAKLEVRVYFLLA